MKLKEKQQSFKTV